MRIFYYQAPQGNFGDDINQWLWEELLPGRWDDEADTLFCGIGTIIGNDMPAAARICVFSSGIGYRPPPPDLWSGRWTVGALRGPLTAQVVGRPDLAAADGALLLSTLPRLAPIPVDDRRDILFVPHYEAVDEGDWAQACDRAGVRLVDPRQCAHRVIDDIRRARLVIADSMHAAIVADAMRVPWVAVASSPRINSFKWLDWTLSLDLPYDPAPLPSISLRSAYHGQAQRIVAEDYRLPRPSRDRALAQYALMARRERSGWWRAWKPRIKHHLRVAPSRLNRLAAMGGIVARWDERQVDRVAAALAQAARAPACLSGDAIFGRRVDQLQTALHGLAQRG